LHARGERVAAVESRGRDHPRGEAAVVAAQEVTLREGSALAVRGLQGEAQRAHRDVCARADEPIAALSGEATTPTVAPWTEAPSSPPTSIPGAAPTARAA